MPLLEEKYNSYRNLGVLVISVIAVVAIYLVLTGFNSKTKVTGQEVSPNAFFQPPALDVQNKTLTGVVKTVPQSENVRYAYGLYDENGKLTSYLSSSKIDFALSDSLKVEVSGKYSINNSLGYAIMDVVSVKLK